MKKWVAGIVVGAVLVPAVSFAFVQEPIPGYVWTYLGPTLGADWQPPPNAFSIIAPFSTQGSTPLAFGSINIGDYPVSAMITAGVAEGLRSAMVVPNTYTQAPQPNTAISGYIENNASGGPSNSAVGGFFFAAQVLGGGQVNGSTFTAQNYRGPYANNGNDFSNIIGAEINLSIGEKAASVTPAGIATGLYIRGFSNVDPTGGSTAIRVLPFGNGISLPWDNGIVLNDGACAICLTLGSSGPGNNVGSSLANWISRTSGGVTNTSTIKTDTSGGFNFLINSVNLFNIEPASSAIGNPLVIGSMTQSAGAGVFLAHAGVNTNLQIQGTLHLADGVTLVSQNDAFNANRGLELVATTIQLNASVAVNLQGLTVGTPVASLCLDASNNIIKKTTAGACL